MKVLFLLVILLVPLAATSQVTDDFYKSLNKIRKSKSLKRLVRSVELEDASRAWLIEMQNKYDRLVHDKIWGGAEVLTNCKDPLPCWMKSPPHRGVLLSKKYRKIGLAYVNGDWCARLE